MWLDGRGGQGNPDDKYTGGITQQPQDTKGWTPDTAHMPNLSSVPYMTTGRRFYLDQLHAQASFAMMAAWTAPRNAFDQVIGGKKWTGLAVFGNQVRGAAWSLRQFQESAYYGADGTFEKSHFERMVKNNVDFLLATASANQEQQGEVFGYIPGDYGNAGHLAPWQQDYFISALALASRQGSSEAVQLMNWTKNFQIGRYVAKPGWNERDGATYNIPYQTSSGAYIKTWAEMGAALVAEGGSNGIDSWTQAQNGDYAQTGMMTLSLIYDATGDTAAKNAFTRIMSLNPPYCDAGTFRGDPNFNYGIVQ